MNKIFHHILSASIFSFATIFNINFCYAEDLNVSTKSKVYEYLEGIPEVPFLNIDKIKTSLFYYYNEVQAIHSGANISIEKNKNNFVLKNPCFAEIAYKFYDDFLVDDIIDLSNNPMLDSNVKLDEVSDQPGSLWKKALAFSNGNKNLAMHLIGLCGHDDGVSERPKVDIEESRFIKLVERRRMLLDKAKKSILNSTVISEELKNNLLSYIVELTGNLKNEINCNRRSFFLPKGLGEEVDISDLLKKKIQEIQAPNKGMHVLNAKYYHIIGAAALACDLNEKGSWSLIGPHVQQMSAVAYRGKRLCDVIDGLLNGQKFRSAKNEREQAKFDAAYLWNKWYTRVKVGGSIGDICLSEPHKRPSALNLFDIFKFLKNGNMCESGWDSQRCDKALKVMDEWEIDYIWSATQHRIGAEFGISQCRPLNDDESIEGFACKAIEH